MINDATALELRDALRARDVSARELTLDALAQARDRADLGAYVSLNPELALAEAEAIDQTIGRTRRDERHELPVLFGLPTAHKDLADQRGHVTTHGSAALLHLPAASDDPIVAAVRAAGAISIGKTQVPEFGIANYSENNVAPPARNPFDPTRTPGGSSGGSAAAIAAGLLPAGIGSDGGGSIRIPAAACGLIGLKPGRGVVPADAAVDREAQQANPFGLPRLIVSGPLARNTHDAALFYDAISGVDPRHPDAPTALRAVERSDEVTGLRIGINTASPFSSWIDIRVAPIMVTALEAATAALAARGHRVEPAEFDYDARYPEAFETVWTQGLSALDDAAVEFSLLTPLSRAFVEFTREVSPDRVRSAVAALEAFAGGARTQWAAFDVVLTPVLADLPPRIGALRDLPPAADYRAQCEWTPHTSMVNVTGLPAVTAPVLHTLEGLPVGVQLIGRPGSELLLLQLAEQLTTR